MRWFALLAAFAALLVASTTAHADPGTQPGVDLSGLTLTT
jgi:hypothetical protein